MISDIMIVIFAAVSIWFAASVFFYVARGGFKEMVLLGVSSVCFAVFFILSFASKSILLISGFPLQLHIFSLAGFVVLSVFAGLGGFKKMRDKKVDLSSLLFFGRK